MMPTIAIWGLKCFNKLFPGQLYVATSRVGSPDNIRFAVKKALPGNHPFLTPNVVYREILLTSQGDDDMSMLSDDSMFNEQMETTPAAAPIEVANDTPRDTDYERPYSGMSLGEEQDDGGPDHAPAQHRWPRHQGRMDLRPHSDIDNHPLPHPQDFFPPPTGPHINPPLSAYELIREANIQVSYYTSLP